MPPFLAKHCIDIQCKTRLAQLPQRETVQETEYEIVKDGDRVDEEERKEEMQSDVVCT